MARLAAGRGGDYGRAMKLLSRIIGYALLIAGLAGGPTLAQVSQGYPPEALRQRLEGTTTFRALIDADGRAKECQIVQSSGHEILDTATCTKVIDHGRFEPARDERGRKTRGWYQSTLKWQLD